MNSQNQFLKAEMVLHLKKHKTDSLIKKRSNQWQNEVHKRSDVPLEIIPVSYGDRFIPRRYSLFTVCKNLKFSTKNTEKDVLNLDFSPDYWRYNSFTIALNNCFRLEELRALKLSDPALVGCDISRASAGSFSTAANDLDWPCRPRAKPLAFAEATHDSPGFDTVFDHNLVDWSMNGQIVASFGKDVIVWKRTDDVTMLFNVKNICSLAYSPDGHFLAIGCKSFEYPVLELWDVSFPTKFLVVNGKVFAAKHSGVQCIAWNQSTTQIICGTGLGTVYVLSVPTLKVLRKVRKHKLPITTIKLSPTMRYLASGDSGGNIVVYNWNSCNVYVVVQSRRKLSTTFDWHPWNGVDLAISENVPASIVILHVPSKEIVAYYQRMDKSVIINSITFSRITGELLVSMSKRGKYTRIILNYKTSALAMIILEEVGGSLELKIIVMSSLNRVVDLLSIPGSGARFVMWSPDGTKLATSGNDETLTIWNFWPENKQKCLRNANFCAKNKNGDLFDYRYGNQFKLWSGLK